MKASTRKFAIAFNRIKKRKEKQGVKMFYVMFSKIYADFLKDAKKVNPDKWIKTINVDKKQVEKVLTNFYVLFADLALMQRKALLGEKSMSDAERMKSFEEEMREIIRKTGGKKITSITNTTRNVLEGLVQDTLIEGADGGLGIAEIARNLEKKVGANLDGNVKARCRAIAQTEMIGASNQAAVNGAKSTGLETRQFWSTSGLERTRATHLADENYSDKVGGLKEGEIFPYTGLRFPGDPNGAKGEIINCRCTLLIEVV